MPQKIIEIVDEFDGWQVINADRLQAARKSLPKQYQKLATIQELTGIDSAQLSQYFSGKATPNLKNLKKLCLYLQIPADFVLGLKVHEISNK